MNVAYLDPPYSRYFSRLARHLTERTGGAVLALLSSPSYRLYTLGDRSLVWKPGEPAGRAALPPALERATWAQADRAALERAFSHAVEWFKERFAAERIDVCLVFSDARPFSAAARVAADALGVTCVYFERGAFRWRTSSLSTHGLNARFDLRAAQRERGITGLRDEDLPGRRPGEPWLRLRFLLFMLHHGLACGLRPQRRALQHKRFHFFNYVRIALAELRARITTPVEPMARPPEPVVLLPLQLPTDSQFVLHSPFRHNQELLDFVVEQSRAALPGAQVLVKKHPMDVRAYRLPEGARFIDGNLAHYHAAASCVVCINSTAGFEAAVHGKPVLCFGESFYTAHPQVMRTRRENFAARLRKAVERGDDPAGGRNLRAAVLRYYQAPGDVWSCVEEDLSRTADIVLQHLGAARPAEGGRSAPRRRKLPSAKPAAEPLRRPA